MIKSNNQAQCQTNEPGFFSGFMEASMTISMFWDQQVQYYEVGRCSLQPLG